MKLMQKSKWILLPLFFVVFFQLHGFAQPLDVTVRQIHLMTMTPPDSFSTIGLFTYDYQPEPEDYYLNGTIEPDGGNPIWVVENLYIPDLSWNELPQSISMRFDLEPLGFVSGQEPSPGQGFIAKLYRSPQPVNDFPAESFFDIFVEIFPFPDNAEGDETPVDPTSPPLEPDAPPLIWNPVDTVSQLEYRGCRVPNLDLDDSVYPDSPEYAGDDNACGPTAAANSLKWLDDVEGEAINLPGDLRQTLTELSGFMQRQRNKGVFIDQFIRGKLDFIEAHNLNINVKFQSESLPGHVPSTSGNTSARNDNLGPQNPWPVWDWLWQQMHEGEDVEIFYKWWDGEKWRGHVVVVTGIEETPSGKKTIRYKHDLDQSSVGGTVQEARRIYIDPHGRMRMYSNGREIYIAHVVAESPGEPFPVELGSYSASYIQHDVHLFWTTESESNNYGFEIFRNDQFLTLIRGQGTTTNSYTYSYIDVNPSTGSNRYDLYQIDFNGQRVLVGSVDMDVKVPLQFSLSQNFPNPVSKQNGSTFGVHSRTSIQYSIPEKNHVSLKLYDLLGHEVATLVQEEKAPGRYSIDFNVSKLASGVYIYKLTAGNYNEIKKLILMR